MSSNVGKDVMSFGKRVQRFIREGGCTQKELAKVLNLNSKVLSRKLNGTSNASLDRREIRTIILTLAKWQALSTQDDVYLLIELAQLEPTFFTEEEWQEPPLSNLGKRTSPTVHAFARTQPSLLHNLPASMTPLIGRAWAIEHLRQMLLREDTRLVTLTGAGGSGKTRLALHIARQQLHAYNHGVWIVSLAGVSDPAFVPLSIVQTLNIGSSPGTSPLHSLNEYLRTRQLMLLLDNFEQVAGAANILHEMLSAAPRLTILVTSRSRLNLSYERQFNVPPLDIPDLNIQFKPANLLQFESVQLFVERAQSIATNFLLTDENASTIARICARLDGLPLALELAAARTRVLSPEQLLERIETTRLSLLSGGAKDLPERQQTLRKTLTWSYDLLSPAEQLWFRRAGVFHGNWMIEAIEAMDQDLPPETPDSGILPIDRLTQLVDSSLVTRLFSSTQPTRYTMLETIREYAREKLQEHGEFEMLSDWHTVYYLRLAEQMEKGLRGARQLAWLAQADANRDNFRAALEWALHKAGQGQYLRSFRSTGTASDTDSRDSGNISAQEVALRLASALRASWEWQGNLTEGRFWLNAALSVPLAQTAGASELAARAKALSETARLMCLRNDQEQAVKLAEDSIALWRQIDDPAGLARALLHRGWAAHAMQDYEKAIEVYQEGIAQLSHRDDPWMRAQLLAHLAAATGFTSNYEGMQSLYARSLAIFENQEDVSATADVLKDWGAILTLKGEYREGIERLVKSLQLCYTLQNKQFIASGLGLLHFAIALLEKPDSVQATINAAKLNGAAEGLMDAIGFTPWTRTDPAIKIVRAAIRSRVDEQTWNSAYAKGRSLTIDQAIELANQLGKSILCD